MSQQLQIQKIIGALITKKRRSTGISREEMAWRMDMSTEGYARYERGITSITLLKLHRIATIFKCSVAELVSESSACFTDQAQKISNMLEGISTTERAEIMKMLELACSLAHKKNKPYLA